ncbi:hypothetical protein D3C76_457260 [compost metagenome]
MDVLQERDFVRVGVWGGQTPAQVTGGFFVFLRNVHHHAVALGHVGELFLVVRVLLDNVDQVLRQQAPEFLQTGNVFFKQVTLGEQVGTGVSGTKHLVPHGDTVGVQRLTGLTDLHEEIVDVVEEAPPQGDVAAVGLQLHRGVTRRGRYPHDLTDEVPRVERALDLDLELLLLGQERVKRVYPLQVRLHQRQHEEVVFHPHVLEQRREFQKRFVLGLQVPDGGRVAIPVPLKEDCFHGVPLAMV